MSEEAKNVSRKTTPPFSPPAASLLNLKTGVAAQAFSININDIFHDLYSHVTP